MTAAATSRLRLFRPRGRAPLRLWLGVTLAAVLLFAALLPLFVSGIDASRVDPVNRLLGPGAPGHVLGTDQLGRDLFARTLASLRWSLGVGVVSASLSTVIGTTMGVIAGASDGLVRRALTRLIDLSLAFPYLVLAVTVMAVVGRGFWPLSVALGLLSWPILARVIYAETLSLMKKEFVVAAELSGVRLPRMIGTHVLPGVRNSMLVMFAFLFADLLVAESGLSFLGIGAPLGAPSLGNMLAEGREYLVSNANLVLVPSAAIVLAVIAANLIGDGFAARTRSRAEQVVG